MFGGRDREVPLASGAEPVQLRQRVLDAGDLPLLEAEVGVTDSALAVDDEEAGPLPERDHRALDVILPEDGPVGIGQARVRKAVLFEEGLCVVEAIRGDRDDLRAALLELRDPVPQLREMLAAERSAEAAQEHQDDGLPSQDGEADLGAVDRGQREVGRGLANGDGLAVYGHDGSHYGRGREGSQTARAFLPVLSSSSTFKCPGGPHHANHHLLRKRRQRRQHTCRGHGRRVRAGGPPDAGVRARAGSRARVRSCTAPVMPERLADNLDAVEGHRRGAEDEFRDWLEQLLVWRGMDVDLADDLSALPGMNHVGRLLDLQSHSASDRYDVIVVDGAPLSQFLDLPAALDASARWLERIFAPRQSNVFEPFLRVFAGDYANAGEDVLERGRELLGRLGELRDDFTDPEVTSVRIVLTPDAPSVDAAEHAVSVLNLFCYGVDALVVNKMLPEAISDPFFHVARDEHRETLRGVTAAVGPMPVLGLEMRSPPPRGAGALAALATEMYAGRDPLAVWHPAPEHTVTLSGGQYVMRVALPFARREDISMEQTDNGVIVHLDRHRCVLPLPREARFFESASWAYDGGVLSVTFER